MTTNECERLRATIAIVLVRYRTHPEFEDIQQEALIACWKVLSDPALRARWAAATLTRRAAQHAAADLCRDPHRGGGWRNHPDWERPARGDVWLNVADPRQQEDFAEVEWNTVHARIQQAVKPREWRLFATHAFGGVLQGDLAKQEGVSFSRVHQIISVVRRAYRKELA